VDVPAPIGNGRFAAKFPGDGKRGAAPNDIETSKKDITSLETEVKAATAKGETPAAKIRLLDSKKERLAVLSKRQDRVCEARENLTLVAAEQDRLVEQIKLLRADAIAARNADTLTARIDATVEHLTETNKLFSEMDQFKDLVLSRRATSRPRLLITVPTTGMRSVPASFRARAMT